MKPGTWILLGSFAVAAYLVTSAQRRAAEAARASKRSTGELVGGLVGGVVGGSPVDLLSDAGAWLRGKFSGEGAPRGSSAEDYKAVDWEAWS